MCVPFVIYSPFKSSLSKASTLFSAWSHAVLLSCLTKRLVCLAKFQENKHSGLYELLPILATRLMNKKVVAVRWHKGWIPSYRHWKTWHAIAIAVQIFLFRRNKKQLLWLRRDRWTSAMHHIKRLALYLHCLWELMHIVLYVTVFLSIWT